MRTDAAERRLVHAALRYLEAGFADEHAHTDAEWGYAAEQLALAARDLTRVVDARPAEDQPVGWNGPEADGGQ